MTEMDDYSRQFKPVLTFEDLSLRAAPLNGPDSLP
jgi:hypothetical protein